MFMNHIVRYVIILQRRRLRVVIPETHVQSRELLLLGYWVIPMVYLPESPGPFPSHAEIQHCAYNFC